MTFDTLRLDPNRDIVSLNNVGLSTHGRFLCMLDESEKTPQAFLLVRNQQSPVS